MAEEVVKSIVTILTAVIAVAFFAVLVSRNANTSQVLTSGGNAFGTILSAATAPVTGAANSFNYGAGAGLPSLGY